MVKLARNEQCITLYPLTDRYSIGPFQAQVIFWPSQCPLILGLICSIRLHTNRYCHFLLVGQIQPVGTVGPLIRWAIFMSKNTLGCLHRVIEYGLLTTARYGRPMNGRLQL